MDAILYFYLLFVSYTKPSPFCQVHLGDIAMRIKVKKHWNMLICFFFRRKKIQTKSKTKDEVQHRGWCRIQSQSSSICDVSMAKPNLTERCHYGSLVKWSSSSGGTDSSEGGKGGNGCDWMDEQVLFLGGGIDVFRLRVAA